MCSPVGAPTERPCRTAEDCPRPFWRTMFRVPYLAGAAALAAVLILGVSLYNRDSDGPGKLNSGIGSGQFRSGAIHLVSPVSDMPQAPTEFRWDAVQAQAAIQWN